MIKNIIILGMYPYPWFHHEINDTMRLMTNSFKNTNKIFINPSIGFRRAWLQRTPFMLNWRCTYDQDVFVCTPPLEIMPSSLGLAKLKDIYTLKLLNRKITLILGQRWRQETILYVSSGGITQSYNVMEALNAKWVIFDVLDDNINFTGISNEDRQKLMKQYSYILKNASITVAVSRYLVDQINNDLGVKVHWLPNGLDIEHFSFKPEFNLPIKEISDMNRPFIGFIGAFTSWIDYDLLIKVSDNIKEGTLILAGPIAENVIDIDLLNELFNRKNVKYLGPIPYQRVPHFFHQFDMLILPRNYLPHSMASDPLKIYEYLATGKPVISTKIPSASIYKDIIYVCEKHEDFLRALEIAPKEWSSEKSSQAKAVVKDMSWEKRAEKLLTIFKNQIQQQDTE